MHGHSFSRWEFLESHGCAGKTTLKFKDPFRLTTFFEFRKLPKLPFVDGDLSSCLHLTRLVSVGESG